jgi:Arc/MetJ-type ribon-helix-helix transcriptional regulator
MNITLSPDTAKRITEKVRNGDFESADAVVEQAVAFYLDYEDEPMDEEEFRQTRAAINEALEQAERGEGTSLEDFDKGMRARYGIQR